jgi:hypothetical protein
VEAEAEYASVGPSNNFLISPSKELRSRYERDDKLSFHFYDIKFAQNARGNGNY